MVKTLTTTLVLIFSIQVIGKDFSRDLDSFSKLVVDPFIEVELIYGDKEHVDITYSGVEPEQIKTEVRGNKLHVYLEDAQINFGLLRRNFEMPRSYNYAKVKMVITYKNIKSIKLRGEEELTCQSKLEGKKLKLKAFGETYVSLSDVDYRKFRVGLFGENEVKIAGKSMNQVYSMFGENRVSATNLESNSVKTTGFGVNIVDINAVDYLSVTQFGEGEVYYSGDPIISKNITLGEATLRRSK